MLGHKEALSQDPTWAALFDDAQRRGLLIADASAESVFPAGPEGGAPGASGSPPGGSQFGVSSGVAFGVSSGVSAGISSGFSPVEGGYAGHEQVGVGQGQFAEQQRAMLQMLDDALDS